MSADRVQRDDVTGVFADWDARDARQAAEDRERDELVAALNVHACRGLVDVRYALDALLPVVDRIAGKRAAEELRAAAEDWPRIDYRFWPQALSDRAAALDARDSATGDQPRSRT